MPAAVSHLLRSCCDEYLYECTSRGLDQDDLKFVCTIGKNVGPSSGFANCCDNLSRRHKMVFCYLGNGLIYISLTSRAFSNFFCDWIGVADCYILHAISPQSKLSAFHEAQVLDVINDSHEESAVLCRHSSFEKEVRTNDTNDSDSSASFES